MVVIPQKLFDSPQVHTLLRDGNVCILEKTLPASFEKKEGYISNHVVSVVLEGTQYIETFEGERISVQAGEILFIPRGLYYITDLIAEQSQFRSILFYFNNTHIEEFLATSSVKHFSKTNLPTHLKFNKIPPIENFVLALISIYKTNRITNKAFLDLKILELLHLLNTLADTRVFANFLFQLSLPKKRNIKSFMQQNFEKPLKIEDYAYLTGRSVSSFRRDFKATFDLTPQKWIKQQRMDKAVQLIKQGSVNVTQLAFDVGYENISYFIQAFKTHTGSSPKQYILDIHRNQLLN